MKKILKVLVILSLFSYLSVSAETQIFTRYIQKGDKGIDVLLLQKTLNSSTSTQIALTGPGSPQNETDFFGELTKQALIKLQKNNNLGSQYGIFTLYSGSLDDKTRAFLNNQNQNIQPTATSTLNDLEALLNSTSTQTIQDQQKLNQNYQQSNTYSISPIISSISPLTANEGDNITIIGKNFSTTTPNTVKLTYNDITATSTDGVTLVIQIKSQIQNMLNSKTTGMNSNQLSNIKSQIPPIPLFIMVQNSMGISNPYQIYLKVK